MLCSVLQFDMQVETAAERKKAPVLQLRHQHADTCQLKAVRQCKAALGAGWADGLDARP